MRKFSSLRAVTAYFTVLGLLLVCSCADVPTPEEMAAANYGPPPPANYQQQIKDYMVGTLKDPFSAEYIFSKPTKGYMHNALIAGGAPHFYWRVDAKINGKNEFGAYVGFQPYTFWFHNGKVVAANNAAGFGFGPNGAPLFTTP